MLATTAPFAPQPTDDAHASVGGDLHTLMARHDSDEEAVRAAAARLDDDGLRPFGLRAFHLNLLSLFGDRWPHDRIVATARAAAVSKLAGGWAYHHRYLPGLDAQPAPLAIEDLPVADLRGVLARGRGLVVVSFHLGPMRHLPSDLVHGGVPVCIPLALDAYRDYDAARRANPDAALWQGFQFVNAEAGGSALVLARTLARGGCVFSTIDGNTGLDGVRGDRRRMTVDVLGVTARVKTGVIGLAERFGAPVQVIVAYTENGVKRCCLAPLIEFPRTAGKDASERAVADAVAAAYAFFGSMLADHADEWCGGDLFHQWRVAPRPAPRDPAAVEQAMALHLASGGGYAVDRRRVVQLGDEMVPVWSDAVSGGCYRFPEELAPLARQLAATGGAVDQAWLDTHEAGHRARLRQLLCQLDARDALSAVAAAPIEILPPDHTELLVRRRSGRAIGGDDAPEAERNRPLRVTSGRIP